MTRPQVWNSDNTLLAQKMWAAGHSIGQIAAEMNLERGAISGIMSRNRDMFPKRGGTGKPAYIAIKKSPRPRFDWNEETLACASDLWEKGRTAAEIGEAIGASASAVSCKAADRRDLFPHRDKKTHSASRDATSTTAKVFNFQRRLEKTRERLAQGLPPTEKTHAGSDLSIYAIEGIIPVRFDDIRDGLCRFPISSESDPVGVDMPCCGIRTLGKVYCTYHTKIAYGPGTVSERNALNGIGGRRA